MLTDAQPISALAFAASYNGHPAGDPRRLRTLPLGATRVQDLWALAQRLRTGAARIEPMSSEDTDDEKLLTRGEVALLCRVHVRTVERWLIAGKLTAHVVLPSGRIMFRRRDVLTVVGRAQTAPPKVEG
jgi:hypothetical protein